MDSLRFGSPILEIFDAGRIRIRSAVLVMACAAIAGCGGGGSADGSAVSAEPAVAASDGASPLTADADADSAVVPQTGGGATVGRRALVRALHVETDLLTVPVAGRYDLTTDFDNPFSSVSTQSDAGVLVHRSHFTLPTDATNDAFGQWRATQWKARIVSDGKSVLRFTGEGLVAFSYGLEYRAASAPYDLPDPVPMDITLHQWDVLDHPGKSIRFFVGTVPGKPDWMRVCWRYELQAILRVSCTRHLKANGDLVGADTVNDLSIEAGHAGPAIHTHESTVGDAFVPTVLRCTVQPTPRNSAPAYKFAVAGFDSSKADGGLFGVQGDTREYGWEPWVDVITDGVAVYNLRVGFKDAVYRQVQVEAGRVVSLRRRDIYYFTYYAMDCN